MIYSADEFVRLRTSENPDDYHRAANEEASEAVWFEVLERFPEMRSWVAHNKSVPLSVLRVLADDADAQVRTAVASKGKLDDELFARLARDNDEGVRHRVAMNAKAPRHILDDLSRDNVEFVAEAARRRV
jgi:hypothetical protein